MRRRIVEVTKTEVRRFRREAVAPTPALDRGLRVSLGETALAKQLQRLEAEQQRKQG